MVLAMAWKGEWQPFFDTLAQAAEAQTSIRDYIQGEKVIQGFLLAYLHVSDFLLSHSEAEFSKGYADLFLEPFLAKYTEIPYGYLIELKYFKRGELTDSKQKKAIREAKAQLKRYLQDERLAAYPSHVQFFGLALVYHGWELVYLKEVL